MDTSVTDLKPDTDALGMDAETKGLLGRFLRDWIYPRWREVGTTLLTSAGLAAATGAYPVIIKQSFDSLLQNKPGALPYVLAAIVIVTLLDNKKQSTN